MHPVLKSLGSMIHVVKNVAVVNWLAGVGEKFSFLPRQVAKAGIRPVICVTHVTDDGRILFGPSISRPVNGQLEYRPLGELHRPIEEIINKSNPVMVGVAIEHLKRLHNWAQQQVRYQAPLPEPVWPSALVAKAFDGKSFVPLTDVQPEEAEGEIMAGRVYEQFQPVLNAQYWNPARILARPENPAAEILGRRRILAGNLLAYAEQTENPETMLKQCVADMREAIPISWRYTDNELLRALENPKAWLPAKNWGAFVDGQPESVLVAMRALLKPAVAEACTDEDLISAAYEPRAPLTVAYRSELQVVEAKALDNLPPFYAGSVLPRSAAVTAPTNVEDDMTPVVSTVAPAAVEA